MLNEKNIYILLTDTGTLLTKMIKLYTKYPLNHASIAFDQELTETYSFGRKRQYNPFIGGFVMENLHNCLFKNAKCAIFSCTVTQEVYDQIYAHVQDIQSNQKQYKYNFLGLFAVLLNKKLVRKNAYFCSQFVSSVFAESGVTLVGKAPEFITPYDFVKSESLQLVFEGKLQNYKCIQPNIVISQAKRAWLIPGPLKSFLSPESLD